MARPSTVAVNNIYLPSETVHFDPDGFDNLLRGNGVVLKHYKAIMCPLGIQDRFDIRSHVDHECDNGFLYKYAGDATVLFTGNSVTPLFEDVGIADGSTVQVTLPRTYDDSDKRIIPDTYDRFFLRDVGAYSTHKQRFEAHATGIDRMEFLVECVEYIVDSHGKFYEEGRDFVIDCGYIKWVPGGQRPGYDPDLNRGTVCSIRFEFKAFWYVQRIVHEIRVARLEDQLTGDVKFIRLPYAVSLQREKVFHDKARFAEEKATDRSVPQPRSGGFGPR